MNKNILCIVVCVLAILLMTVLDSRGQIGITGNAAFVGAAGFSAAGGGGGGSCNTVHAENVAAKTGVHYGGSAKWIGQSGYDPGSSISVCKVQVTGTLENGVVYVASIWSQSSVAGALVTQQGSYSATTTGDGTDKSYDFSFASSIAISGGNYWAIVISRQDGGDLNGVNISTDVSAAGGISGYMGRWLSNQAQDDWDTTDCIFKIYK